MENIFPVSENIKKYFRENYFNNDEGGRLQELIKNLKNKGCSQMQTIFLFITEGGLPFKEANQIILDSEAWK